MYKDQAAAADRQFVLGMPAFAGGRNRTAPYEPTSAQVEEIRVDEVEHLLAIRCAASVNSNKFTGLGSLTKFNISLKVSYNLVKDAKFAQFREHAAGNEFSAWKIRGHMKFPTAPRRVYLHPL